jgi:hypothetical protein
MAIRTGTVLKSFFETGDYPTQDQFGDLIDSTANTNITGAITIDSSNVATLAKIAISTPTFTANVYTLVLTDDGKFLQLNNSSTAGDLEIPLNATVAYEIGTQILLRQTGSGLITIKSTAGATLQSEGASTASRSFASQYSSISLIKVATNTWSISGNLA